MDKKTIATMFGGGGGVELGAIEAGFGPLWTIEYDLQIALWHQLNFSDSQVIWSDVCEVDYTQLTTPHWLHASPQCKRASVANQAGESEEDIAQAEAMCSALIALTPNVFTLENVYFYRTFESFALVLKCLHQLGYEFDYWHLNSADYGVPQTRRRLFLVARRDGKPVTQPEATHTQHPQPGLFGQPLKPWVGWHEAIEDLIPDLPESKFAPWQESRLPDELTSFMIGSGTRSDYKSPDKPSDTITSNSNQVCIKSFLVDSQNGNSSWNPTVRVGDCPASTITNQKKGLSKAFIVSDCDGTLRLDNEPHCTVRPNDKGGTTNRAYLNTGKIVKMTPCALARFQSFPDSYQLPTKTWLACKIIGNAVPPKLAYAIANTL